jgi:hypothetical protein
MLSNYIRLANVVLHQNAFCFLQVMGYTEVTHVEDQEGEGSVSGSIAKNTNSLENPAAVEQLDKTSHKHGVMGVDDIMHASIVHAKPLAADVNSFSAVRSQLSSEHWVSEPESTESTPLVRKGSSTDEVDISTIGNCDVSVSTQESGRTGGKDQNYERTNGCVQDGAEQDFKSPNGSSNISLESDVEFRNGTVTKILPYGVGSEGNTSSEQLLDMNVSCQTSDMSHADLNMPHSTDTERCFNKELSEVPEDICEAGASMKGDVDKPEKADDVGHNDDSDKAILDKTNEWKEPLTSVKFKSYDEAHKKCGLILCNFPTVSNLVFIGKVKLSLCLVN